MRGKISSLNRIGVSMIWENTLFLEKFKWLESHYCFFFRYFFRFFQYYRLQFEQQVYYHYCLNSFIYFTKPSKLFSNRVSCEMFDKLKLTNSGLKLPYVYNNFYLIGVLNVYLLLNISYKISKNMYSGSSKTKILWSNFYISKFSVVDLTYNPYNRLLSQSYSIANSCKALEFLNRLFFSKLPSNHSKKFISKIKKMRANAFVRSKLLLLSKFSRKKQKKKKKQIFKFKKFGLKLFKTKFNFFDIFNCFFFYLIPSNLFKLRRKLISKFIKIFLKKRLPQSRSVFYLIFLLNFFKKKFFMTKQLFRLSSLSSKLLVYGLHNTFIGSRLQNTYININKSFYNTKLFKKLKKICFIPYKETMYTHYFNLSNYLRGFIFLEPEFQILYDKYSFGVNPFCGINDDFFLQQPLLHFFSQKFFYYSEFSINQLLNKLLKFTDKFVTSRKQNFEPKSPLLNFWDHEDIFSTAISDEELELDEEYLQNEDSVFDDLEPQVKYIRINSKHNFISFTQTNLFIFNAQYIHDFDLTLKLNYFDLYISLIGPAHVFYFLTKTKKQTKKQFDKKSNELQNKLKIEQPQSLEVSNSKKLKFKENSIANLNPFSIDFLERKHELFDLDYTTIGEKSSKPSLLEIDNSVLEHVLKDGNLGLFNSNNTTETFIKNNISTKNNYHQFSNSFEFYFNFFSKDLDTLFDFYFYNDLLKFDLNENYNFFTDIFLKKFVLKMSKISNKKFKHIKFLYIVPKFYTLKPLLTNFSKNTYKPNLIINSNVVNLYKHITIPQPRSKNFWKFRKFNKFEVILNSFDFNKLV